MSADNSFRCLFLGAGNLVKTEIGGLALLGPRGKINFSLSKVEAEAFADHFQHLTKHWDLLIVNCWRHFDADEVVRPYRQTIFSCDTSDLVVRLEVFQREVNLVLTRNWLHRSESLVIRDREKFLLEAFLIHSFV